MIRWGIIGCGNVTEVKSGPGFQKAFGSSLVAVMRRTSELARDYAERHGVPKWTTDADEIIHDHNIDAVYIATPPDTHLEYALKVCAAGKPAYVEKPMARNATEAAKMVRAFESAGLPLFIAHYRRALPRFQKAKQLLEEGAIGQLTAVNYRYASDHRDVDPTNLPWRLQAEKSGGGIFLDLAPHTLDILDFLLGPLLNVRGHAANVASPYAVEDVVDIVFSTHGGALGTGLWNFASGVREDTIELTGTDGRLSLSTFGDDPLKLQRGSEVETIHAPNPPHIQQPLIQTIVDELLGIGRCPSTGQTALRTSYVMDKVLEDFYGGRSDAFWERPDSWPGRRWSDSGSSSHALDAD